MIDRWSTPVWKSADGTIETLARIPVGQAPFEEWVLRDFLADTPSLLPVRHFDPVFSSPVCLGTEFPVSGVGRIDALFLSPSGYVTIVETKLWQNPEARREVVAQIIDYAQQVARWTYADLESRFKKCQEVAKQPSSSLFSYVCDLEDDSSDEAEFTDAVNRCLGNGRFLLLIIGDGIREGVEQMTEFLQRTPLLQYTLGPVGGELLLSPQSVEIIKFGDPGSGREDVPMRDPIILLVHLIATLARLMGPGGLRSVVAESVLVKQQLLMLNRSRHRAPNLCASDRILAGVCAQFMRPARVIRSAIVLRPSTILEFHRALRTRKYRWLFSPTRRRTGPQGPSKALVDAIVDMKRRNPRWGCPRIAQQIALAFAVDIDKDVVRRVLATHSRPAPHSGGPSWLTFLGHAKDSLWSIDLFRCESAILRSHWVLVVMDHYTRRIVGFGIHAGTVDGRALCRMFNHAIRGLSRPKRLSSDHDPLSRFHQWRANLRVLQVTEVKSVPYVPLSHPFVERLIGTLRRECVDQLLFWSASDLEDKLVAFQDFYNAHRAHASLDGRTPVPIQKDVARLDRYRWDAHCRGLYQTPIAA